VRPKNRITVVEQKYPLLARAMNGGRVHFGASRPFVQQCAQGPMRWVLSVGRVFASGKQRPDVASKDTLCSFTTSLPLTARYLGAAQLGAVLVSG
jgi:hypothetical protein